MNNPTSKKDAKKCGHRGKTTVGPRMIIEVREISPEGLIIISHDRKSPLADKMPVQTFQDRINELYRQYPARSDNRSSKEKANDILQRSKELKEERKRVIAENTARNAANRKMQQERDARKKELQIVALLEELNK